MTQPKIVLASNSPRRRELLARMGIECEVIPSGVDESAIPADHPRTFAIRAAYAKAMDVAQSQSEGTVVIGADTVVTKSLQLYGKPSDAEAARDMLHSLSGDSHQVITGVAVAIAGRPEAMLDSETTDVVFRNLSQREIEDYIATGRVFDKAGAYAIQEEAGGFVDHLEGDYFNVVGLPCALLVRMLSEAIPGSRYRVPAPPERWR
ncbi:septum formation protein Maf [bacterium]|nr:septum formation protein Maf [bacterium]